MKIQSAIKSDGKHLILPNQYSPTAPQAYSVSSIFPRYRIAHDRISPSPSFSTGIHTTISLSSPLFRSLFFRFLLMQLHFPPQILSVVSSSILCPIVITGHPHCIPRYIHCHPLPPLLFHSSLTSPAPLPPSGFFSTIFTWEGPDK